jgi:predicted outer membrane protein
MVGKLNGVMLVGVAGIALGALPVAAQNRPTGPDQELVMRLHQLGQDEITMARLGETRGVGAGVKAFAAAVQRDHRAVDLRLLAYAEAKNMNMEAVASPGGALAHGALAMAPLMNCARAEFDYNFVSQMVADHQAAIDAAAAAQRLARDPELRQLIGDTLAVFSDHLVSAQQLLGGIPEPPRRVLQLPGEPSVVSRTQTGADEPSAAALAR